MYVGCGPILFGGVRKGIESAESTREAATDRKMVRLEVGSYDSVTGYVKGAGQMQTFGHAHARDEDGLGRARGVTLGGAIADKRSYGVTDKEYEGRKREEEEGDEDEGNVLCSLEVRGGMCV